MNDNIGDRNTLPLADDIKVEYHPKSQWAEEIFHFEDYKLTGTAKEPDPIDKKPYVHSIQALTLSLQSLYLMHILMNPNQQYSFHLFTGL